MPKKMRGIPFNELEEGQVFWSVGRTVTEKDTMDVCALAGDYNPMHTDKAYANQSFFGEAIPPGYLSILFVMGFIDRLGFMEGVGKAFLGMEWSYHAPVKTGDTIHCKITCDELKEVSNPDEGIVTYGIEVFNEDEDLVQTGEFTFLIKREFDGEV